MVACESCKRFLSAGYAVKILMFRVGSPKLGRIKQNCAGRRYPSTRKLDCMLSLRITGDEAFLLWALLPRPRGWRYNPLQAAMAACLGVLRELWGLKSSELRVCAEMINQL